MASDFLKYYFLKYINDIFLFFNIYFLHHHIKTI
jgi:hypothetical protein